MSNRETVENFIEERKKRAIKFIVIQSVLDIAAAIAIGFIIARALENGKSIVPHILVLVLVITSTFSSQIRVYFGSFKKFVWQSNIFGSYNTAKEALEKAQKGNEKGKISDTDLVTAQKAFDDAINEIAKEITAADNK